MKKELEEALHDFYQKVLHSEFATLKDKQLEHDNKLLDILGHFDSLYKRLDRLEDEYYSILQGIKRGTVKISIKNDSTELAEVRGTI